MIQSVGNKSSRITLLQKLTDELVPFITSDASIYHSLECIKGLHKALLTQLSNKLTEFDIVGKNIADVNDRIDYLKIQLQNQEKLLDDNYHRKTSKNLTEVHQFVEEIKVCLFC